MISMRVNDMTTSIKKALRDAFEASGPQPNDLDYFIAGAEWVTAEVKKFKVDNDAAIALKEMVEELVHGTSKTN
jgi:hypothetical protein